MDKRDHERLGFESCWDVHPDYPKEDWQAEVANGDTVLGYWAWVEAAVEMAEAETE